VNDALSLGDIEILDTREQLECGGTVEACFFCIDCFGRFDACVGKKLLRFSTGLSSGTMVTPIEFWHHLPPSYALWLFVAADLSLFDRRL
jgi:hypothetical protein